MNNFNEESVCIRGQKVGSLKGVNMAGNFSANFGSIVVFLISVMN